MPIIANFPGGAGGGSGLSLGAVSDIQTMVAHNKVYIKWTDPSDLVVAEATLAAWGGTLLVRKEGSAPVSRRDGVQVIDSKERDKYKDTYYCDTGVVDGKTYYYKFFPYTTTNSFTDDSRNEFTIVPEAVKLGNVTGMSAVAAGNGKLDIKWTDPDATIVQNSIEVAKWGSTTVVVKEGSYATSPDDGDAAFTKKSVTRNEHSTTPLTATGLKNGVTYYISFFPTTDEGVVNDNEANRITGVPNRLQIAKVPTQNGTLTYNENVQEPKWNDYDESKMTLGGQTSGVAAGDYEAEFTPKDDYCWPDNSIETKKVTWKINKASISVPTTKSTFTYDGGVKTPVWDDYDAKKMTIGGTQSETNAGDYKVTFTPTANYQWTDGKTDTREVSWSIAKAPCGLSVSPNTVTLNSSALSATVTVTRLGNGTVTATSNDASVASATVSNPTAANPTIAVAHVNQNTGNTTITVKSAASANYAAGETTVTVAAQFMPAKKALNDMTWNEISQVSEAGKGSEYWNVGDRKAVQLKGTVGTLALDTTLYVYILSFDHNSAKEGKGIHFGTFKTALTGGTDVCLIDSYYNSYQSYNGTKYFQMNHWGTSSNYNTNYGGWKACDMRYDILGSTNTAPSGYGSQKSTSAVGYDAPANTATSPVVNTLMAALPADLRAVMKPITKYTDNTGNSSNVTGNVTTSVDYLPLLAEWEIFGARSNANQYEKDYQVQYAYYAASNSKVKYRHSSTGSTARWWERSPTCNNADSFCFVSANGAAGYSSAGTSYGLAPAFMV